MTLAVHVLRLSARGHTLLHDLRFEVAPGEILTITGPSGCGKSSLLAALAGTLSADGGMHFEGRVRLGDDDITTWPTARRGVGLLFQDDLLFAHMTVGENLLFAVPAGARVARWAAVQAALDEAGLSGFAERDPATLSGGQRARVALMRALLAQPRALLLDEPFSRLDTALRAQFRAFVFEHVRSRGLPVVLVSHDRDDIADPARVVALGHA